MGTYVKDGNNCIGCSLLEGFPDRCGGCRNLKGKVELIKLHASMKLPSPCTPAQYKEITGKDWPDDCLVWINGDPYKYYYVKCHYEPGAMTIVQTSQPAPAADWRPDKEGK